MTSLPATTVPVLFAGPTLHRALAIHPALPLARFEVRPPARRGDIAALARARPPGVAILVDGLFHAALAVGHAELRDAIRAGWCIHGGSSLGAIRARELRGHGMLGFGAVYRWYCDDTTDVRDDEVTLLHDEEPPYRELSEPLVHLRALAASLVTAGAITAAERDAVIAALAAQWYGHRTLARMGTLLRALPRADADAAAHADAVRSALADLDRHRVKAHDLIAFLTTGGASGPAPRP